MSPDPVLDSETQASVSEAGSVLLSIGLEAAALPQQAHQVCPEALEAYPATVHKYQFSFLHNMLASDMVFMDRA